MPADGLATEPACGDLRSRRGARRAHGAARRARAVQEGRVAARKGAAPRLPHQRERAGARGEPVAAREGGAREAPWRATRPRGASPWSGPASASSRSRRCSTSGRTRRCRSCPDSRRRLQSRFHMFLRDHFTNQATRMDTRLIGVLTRVAGKFSAQRIDVVSGYRSPKYNLMLRKKGHQVARDSQHTHGNAVDFRITRRGDAAGAALRALAARRRRRLLPALAVRPQRHRPRPLLDRFVTSPGAARHWPVASADAAARKLGRKRARAVLAAFESDRGLDHTGRAGTGS